MGVDLDIPSSPSATGLQTFALFINFFFPATALVVVTTRAAGRLATSQFGWDDSLVCIAMLMSVAETVISYFFIKTDFIGIHFADIPPHDPTESLIWEYAVQILYQPILGLVKSSVLIFLLKLFGQRPGVRRFIIGLNTANLLQMVAVFFAITLQCLPIAFNWDPTVPGGSCVDRRVLYASTSALNIVTDFLVLGLPMWIFLGLKLPTRTKVGLMFVFLLGILVTITSIVRLVVLVQFQFGLVHPSDPTFNIGFVTSAIETNLALITASAPALCPLFRSRARVGWLPRPSFFPSRATDPEMGTSKSTKYGTNSSVVAVGSGVGGKYGRGGGRAGRPRGGKKPSIRVIRTDPSAAAPRELRGRSPRHSEEEAMTPDGIVRVSDIQREIDCIAQEIAVLEEMVPRRPGTYTGVMPPPKPAPTTALPSPPRPPPLRGASAPVLPPIWTGQRPLSLDSATRLALRVSLEGRRSPETCYSASIYSDADSWWLFAGGEFASSASRTEDRDVWHEERLSKYGAKRNGVVTPLGTTPTRWSWQESGTPF